MQINIDYGQAVDVTKSVLQSDYQALMEGLFQFDSVEEERGLIEAYGVVMRWYNGYCDVPPEGWYCTRASGHDGPCAAYPVKQGL